MATNTCYPSVCFGGLALEDTNWPSEKLSDSGLVWYVNAWETVCGCYTEHTSVVEILKRKREDEIPDSRFEVIERVMFDVSP